MSHISKGTIFKTPSGKYLRTFQVKHDLGTQTFVQETPDIHCATVQRVLEPKVRERAERQFGKLEAVEIEVTREIKIVS
jgi:hypothetical protein